MSAVYWYRFQVPHLADVQPEGTVPPKKKRKPEAVEKTKPREKNTRGKNWKTGTSLDIRTRIAPEWFDLSRVLHVHTTLCSATRSLRVVFSHPRPWLYGVGSVSSSPRLGPWPGFCSLVSLASSRRASGQYSLRPLLNSRVRWY